MNGRLGNTEQLENLVIKQGQITKTLKIILTVILRKQLYGTGRDLQTQNPEWEGIFRYGIQMFQTKNQEGLIKF